MRFPTATALVLLALLGLPSCFSSTKHQGERLYVQHCAGCHGEQGEGIGQLVPPLAGSDYLAQHSGQLACIVRYGLNGPIVVKGVAYNQLMLGVQDTTTHHQLSPAQVTNLLNFIEGHWGNHPGPAGVRTIAGTEAELRACAPR
ncbi:c-type cytochrome [Hymenobacter cheonanensis]|uniref:c-type cytochrome n=1 Tax=Hymenobacter sp. CA2-7 TaxID=3063993 RepID=UPI00271424DA|nr:cytochrome c [Hymenobacter sp. CA2-7]MDO7886765.1 cytochrome c [Hymenobacter sp. CA2-7]